MRIKFILIVCLQVLLLLGIIAYREYWIATGDKVVLKTTPVDPRDLFRGDYVNLTYEITNLLLDSGSQKPDFLPGQSIYVNLDMIADGTSFAASVSKERPASGQYIQGRVRNEYRESKWNLTFQDDNGVKREVTHSGMQGLKKGDAITACLDNQGSMLSYNKDNAAYKQPCWQGIQPVHGIVGEITEIRTKKVNVQYGIESYFVEEGKGIQLEQGRNVRGPMKVEVSLRKDGKGIISRLLPDKQ
ncbi:MAG: GDYXXLXY domain-containing protein [Nitrospirae bacterium]|nr:GDYXXLXY domain-containing protein [Nitrospirota bacterium]